MMPIARLDLMGVIAVVLMAAGAQGQSFTTAAEVKPILTATKPNWIAVRPYDGRDLLYFTNALAWRCALTEIRYGVNGAPAETVLPMEPCYEAEATPNALKMESILPYVALPIGSVQSVSVEVTYDDGSKDLADYQRDAVLIE
ncbi:MAG: hypothetical protein ABI832_02895 [bacterium]